jgi:hypothetical protein
MDLAAPYCSRGQCHGGRVRSKAGPSGRTSHANRDQTTFRVASQPRAGIFTPAGRPDSPATRRNRRCRRTIMARQMRHGLFLKNYHIERCVIYRGMSTTLGCVAVRRGSSQCAQERDRALSFANDARLAAARVPARRETSPQGRANRCSARIPLYQRRCFKASLGARPESRRPAGPASRASRPLDSRAPTRRPRSVVDPRASV